MQFDPDKIVKKRTALGYSQETVATLSNVSVRTVQRAERGESLRRENMADIAAALKAPMHSLCLSEEQAEPTPLNGDLVTLRKTGSGREIIDLIEQSRLCKLECDVDPSEENMPLLTDLITTIEAWIPNPWDDRPRFESLVQRLQTIATLNGAIGRLDEIGIHTFIGRRFVWAVMPRNSEEGYWVTPFQKPDMVSAARILISSSAADKRVVDAHVDWPVEVVRSDAEDADEASDDVPF